MFQFANVPAEHPQLVYAYFPGLGLVSRIVVLDQEEWDNGAPFMAIIIWCMLSPSVEILDLRAIRNAYVITKATHGAISPTKAIAPPYD